MVVALSGAHVCILTLVACHGAKLTHIVAIEKELNKQISKKDRQKVGKVIGDHPSGIHKALRSADEGKIVMVISHAPDRASELFNKVVVLAKSVQDNCGHLAFFGSIQEAKDFFETDSLEGVVKRINRADEGGDGLSDYYIQKYSERMSK